MFFQKFFHFVCFQICWHLSCSYVLHPFNLIYLIYVLKEFLMLFIYVFPLHQSGRYFSSLLVLAFQILSVDRIYISLICTHICFLIFLFHWFILFFFNLSQTLRSFIFFLLLLFIFLRIKLFLIQIYCSIPKVLIYIFFIIFQF